jgi:hypothetical protein
MQTDEIDVGTAAHPGDAPSANGANQALAVNSLAVGTHTQRSERTKYTTRTTQDYGLTLTDAEAFDNFVYRVESLAISEVSEWRNQLAQKTNEPSRDDKV